MKFNQIIDLDIASDDTCTTVHAVWRLRLEILSIEFLKQLSKNKFDFEFWAKLKSKAKCDS